MDSGLAATATLLVAIEKKVTPRFRLPRAEGSSARRTWGRVPSTELRNEPMPMIAERAYWWFRTHSFHRSNAVRPAATCSRW